tara:strand:- start:460 stop:966 length:507 start_codon:yes stop_codon:yes gene_type:complete
MDLIGVVNLVVTAILLTLVIVLYMKLENVSKSDKTDDDTNESDDKNGNSKTDSDKTVRVLRVNIPTRGEKTDYRSVGVISQGERLLKLMGRETYSGSDKWQYYALSDQFNSARLTVVKNGRECDDTLGCNELYDRDLVIVPDISENLQFKVNIHDNLDSDKLKYIPFV